MSKLVFETILNEVLSSIDFPVAPVDFDKEQLYQEILHYFGLIGALNTCQALETAWCDPYNHSEMRDFILAWLRKKARKTEKTPGVI